MLGKIKALERNVRDLYLMCHDEFETKMTSQCYNHCQNLAELIQTLKEDVLFNSLKQPSDKYGLSKMYDKLCNIESDLIELMRTVKPIGPKKLNQSRVPKTIGSCKSCQGRQSKAGKSPHYSTPSKSRQMDNNGYDWSSDSNSDHYYDRLSFVDLDNLPRTRKVYRYPSIESLSSSSSSSILVEEYYVVPKKRSENYRMLREKLPFNVESTNNKVYKTRKRNLPRFRKPQIITATSVRKYDPGDFERSYEYKQKPRRRKRKKRKNENFKQGDNIYFVTKTKGGIHSGINTQERDGPNSKYVVSRLRRIPTPADFNNGNSRVNAVKFRDIEYPRSDGERWQLSDSNSSRTSIESNFIRAKWRRNKSKRPMKKGQLFPQSSLANRPHFDHTVLRVRRSSCDDCATERNTQNQCNRTSRRAKCNSNFAANPYNSQECSIVYSNYEVIDSFYRGSFNSQDAKRTKNNTKPPPILFYHVRRNSLINSVQGASENKRDISHRLDSDKKSYSFSKTPIVHSLYINETPLYETSIGEAPQYKYSVSSSSWYTQRKTARIPRTVKPFRGQNKRPENQVSVYQIIDKTQSNPFIKKDSNRKSSSAKLTPSKKSSSFFNRRKSIMQKQMSGEAIIHNIDYSNIKEGVDVKDDTVVSSRKYSSVAPLAKTSKTGKLSKAGSKIKNLVRSVSKLKLKRQDTKNSVINSSESLPSIIHSDPDTKVESIYKQPTYEDSNKLKSGSLGKSQLGGILPATSHIDNTNQRQTNSSSDVYKPNINIRGLTYSLRYEKENRRDMECNHWPTTASLNHFDSNCTTLMSEERIDLREHKFNGSHNELHTHRIYPSTTELAYKDRKCGVLSPKLTDLKPDSLDHKERKDVDWKQIVNEIKES